MPSGYTYYTTIWKRSKAIFEGGFWKKNPDSTKTYFDVGQSQINIWEKMSGQLRIYNKTLRKEIANNPKMALKKKISGKLALRINLTDEAQWRYRKAQQPVTSWKASCLFLQLVSKVLYPRAQLRPLKRYPAGTTRETCVCGCAAWIASGTWPRSVDRRGSSPCGRSGAAWAEGVPWRPWRRTSTSTSRDSRRCREEAGRRMPAPDGCPSAENPGLCSTPRDAAADAGTETKGCLQA